MTVYLSFYGFGIWNMFLNKKKEIENSSNLYFPTQYPLVIFVSGYTTEWGLNGLSLEQELILKKSRGSFRIKPIWSDIRLTKN